MTPPPSRHEARWFASGYWKVKVLPYVLLGVLGASGGAAAAEWSHEAPLTIVTYEHTFHRVHAASDACAVAVRLHLEAPKKAYSSRVPSDNHYAFLVRVKLSGGKTLVSPPLTNATPGRRVLSFREETGAEGCWAGKAHKLRKVDVHACKGKGCSPRPW